MSAEVQVVQLSRRPKDIRRFLLTSYPIYQDDPHWVAPLLFDLEKVFTKKNPFFEHAEMALWVARRGGRDIGRIAAIRDENYNRTHQDNTVFFGFFECARDAEASRRLFESVFAWARQHRARRLLGPMNPSSNDECGLLVSGFDTPPVFMMPHNPPYYSEFVAAEGFQKAKDLLAYYLDLANTPMERFERIAHKIRQRYPELQVRAVHRKSLQQDLAKLTEVYNAAWEQNWGFVPITPAEVDFLAERLKPVLREGLVWLAETATEPVAFLLAVPDYNEAFKYLRGRLLTPRLWRALPYFLGWKEPKMARVITLGVKKPYRGHGLESTMLYEGLKVGFRIGFQGAEASWILEDNLKMRRIMELFGGKPYKTYRLYEKAL